VNGTSALSLLFPSPCLSCGAVTENNHLFCPECDRYALRLLRACRRCGTFVERPEEAVDDCPLCRGKKFAFDRLSSPYLYAGAVAKAVTTMKYTPLRRSAVAMGRFLADHIPDEMRVADRVIYPPMTRLALLSRGFNQAAVIADEVARRAGLFLDTHTLKKVKRTTQQAGRSFEERRKNLADAFALTRPVTGKRFLLIDDVATTLATADAIAHLLKEHGAEKVFVLTFARKSLHFE